MTCRSYALLFLLGFGLALAVAFFLPAPGYMDAEYYFAGGLRLAGGHGFSEPFLWNYLDDPAGLPHPSHGYWMPLASLLAALGLRLAGSEAFAAGRFPFLLVAGCLPPLTAALAYSLTYRRDLAFLSGLLAVFPAFYLTFMPTTDTFGLYMLLGGVFFLAAGRGPKRERWRYLALGGVAGLMHLARADGLLWLGVALLAALLGALDGAGPRKRPRSFLMLASLVLLGYLLVMGPWFGRNLAAFGTPLAPGGAKALWLTSYNELYAYPAGSLTPGRWWASGVGEILRVRLEAGGENLLRTVAIIGEIFIGPLALAGLWRLRSDRRVALGAAAWLLTFLVMTVLFPFQGTRGGFFHSGAALQTLVWAAAPAGLEAFIDLGVRKRGWHPGQAGPVFRVGLVSLAALMTVFLGASRAVLPAAQASHGADLAAYRELAEALDTAGAKNQDLVMVNNTPGFFLAAKRPAISIPDGGVDTLLAAGRRYGARFVLLEYNHPVPLDALYANPQDHLGLEYLRTVNGTHLFVITGARE
jgi:hypothetical protein